MIDEELDDDSLVACWGLNFRNYWNLMYSIFCSFEPLELSYLLNRDRHCKNIILILLSR